MYVFIFLSVGDSTGADVKSNGYNVLMVGDTSVGKTSFMKRAQSGKFSLDLPASVGKIPIFTQCKFYKYAEIDRWMLHKYVL